VLGLAFLPQAPPAGGA